MPRRSLVWFQRGQARITNKGLLVEESRTNLAIRSDNFGSPGWVGNTAVTITSDATSAPDGSQTSDQIAASAGTTGHLGQTIVTTSATTYVFSVYLKQGTSTQTRLLSRGPQRRQNVCDLQGLTPQVEAQLLEPQKTVATRLWAKGDTLLVNGSFAQGFEIYAGLSDAAWGQLITTAEHMVL